MGLGQEATQQVSGGCFEVIVAFVLQPQESLLALLPQDGYIYVSAFILLSCDKGPSLFVCLSTLCSCREELGGEFSRTGESLPAKVTAEPNGTLLLANSTSGDLAAAHRLAARLYHLDGFKKSQVAAFLQKK